MALTVLWACGPVGPSSRLHVGKGRLAKDGKRFVTAGHIGQPKGGKTRRRPHESSPKILIRLIGGPGGTRTPNQTVMSGRL